MVALAVSVLSDATQIRNTLRNCREVLELRFRSSEKRHANTGPHVRVHHTISLSGRLLEQAASEFFNERVTCVVF